MMDQGLAPRVEHGEEADRGAEMPRVGRDGVEGLGRGAEQDAVHEGFVLQRDRSNRLGDREDNVGPSGISMGHRDPGDS